MYNLSGDTNTNLVNAKGNTGGISYTYITDDITKNSGKVDFIPYFDRFCLCENMELYKEKIICRSKENKFKIIYSLDEELVIELECKNDNISELAFNFDLNFMGVKGTDYKKQLLPTSPYTSDNGKYIYYTMTSPNGKFMTILAQTPSDGWRLRYSDISLCHYIDGIQFFASFDRKFRGSGRKRIKLRVFFSDTMEEVYKNVGKIYDRPYCFNIVSGGFGGSVVKCSDDTEKVKIISPSKKITYMKSDKNGNVVFCPKEYGIHKVIPLKNETEGLNITIWNGTDYNKLYEKSCDTIKKPYHIDQNLCEGGMFLWAMLLYMNKTGTKKYDAIVRQELDVIIGQNGENVPRKTIVPYKTDRFEAYHISDSDRIQEQFAGVSILLEAYKLYNEEKYLTYAINALNELIDNRLSDDGMIFRFNDSGRIEDYTTVYVPIISIADMAVYLKNKDNKKSEKFADAAVKIADFLVRRGLNFPTEGELNPNKEPEMEDGSISCTALSVLYVYHYIKRDAKYLEFAKKILDLHNTWVIYTPDARMYQSSFRWWETIWEGDGAGPAICAGHAWTIWRAEALFLYGIEANDDECLLKSWNGFVTNFAKINGKGESYSCYEADYIRGGGAVNIRKSLLQLQGEDISKEYRIAHDYPKHTDSSLSRFVWIRCESTWAGVAAILNIKGNIIGINIQREKGEWSVGKDIKRVYIGNISKSEKIIINNIDVDTRNTYYEINHNL